MLIERYVSISDAYHPATLFRFIAQQLAIKVNKRGPKQQAISGMLSGVILFSLTIALVVIIINVATFGWFFEALFLLVAFRLRVLIIQCNKIQQSLVKQHKTLAREQLTLLCIRDTNALSTMGIVKAAIESLIQRSTQSYFNIIIYYAVFGIYIALSVAVINALANYWNPKKQTFRHFGRLFSDLAKTINVPIQYLITLLTALLFSTKHLSLKRNQWHNAAMGALLTTTANTLKRQLGGAVMYDNVKIRRPKLGPDQLPATDDLSYIVTVVEKLRHSIFVILLLSVTTSLILTNL